MTAQDDRQDERIRYLLGDVSEEDAQRLEAEYLEEDGAFDALLAAEDELFFDYARGGLSDGERRKFEARFLHDDEGRRRLARTRVVSKALRPRSALRRPSVWIGLAAAALLVLAFWSIVRRGPVDDPDRSIAAVTPVPPRANPVVVLTPGAEARVYVPADAPTLTLEITLPEARPDAPWQLVLSTADGASVWRSENPIRSAVRTLKVEIPARGLAEDEYALVLSDGGGAPAVYGFVLLRD